MPALVPTPPKVAVVGLGLMGGTLVSHLLDQGKVVVGFDPDPERRRDHRARGGEVAPSLPEAVRDVDVVLLSLPNGDVVRQVGAEIAASPSVQPGLLVIDTTTGDPDRSVEVAEVLAAAGVGYVDATVSGNAAQARDKDVVFMVGGRPDHVERAEAVLEPLGRRVHRAGDVGAGSRMKLIVNHVLTINRAAVAEGLAVAERAGMDLGRVLAVLNDGAAYSKAMDIWGDQMVTGEHWPPASRISISVKDAGLIARHAAGLGASIELHDQVAKVFDEAVEGGLADADNSAVIEVMRWRAGGGADGGAKLPPATDTTSDQGEGPRGS